MNLKSLLSFAAVAFTSLPAFAQEAAEEAAGSNSGMAFAVALCIALPACVGAIAQSKAASTALEGIARNPGAQKQLFTPMILALALIESLVIYALIIAFILGNKF